MIALYKDRIATLVELADAVEPVYLDIRPADELLTQHMNEASKAALADLVGSFAACEWSREAISAAIKSVMKSHGLKMPQVAIPLRVLLLGMTQTPAIDALVEVMGRELVTRRVSAYL